jgi:L,D-transpeptidase catalytic domain
LGRCRAAPIASHGGSSDKHGVEMRAARHRAFAPLLLALAAVLVAAPSAGARRDASRIPALALSWQAPTPADGKTYTTPAGSKLSVGFAVGTEGGAARIWASGLPAQAVLSAKPGMPATAQLNWTPNRAQIGTHAFVFAAGSERGTIATQPRTIFVQVVPASPPGIADVTPIGTDGVYRWAYIYRPTAARVRPTTSARVITRLKLFTLDSTVNLVLLVGRKLDGRGRLWYRVRLPILPNNSTGWVRADDLTTVRSVSTYLVIYRKLFTATLYRNGRPIFRTRVGVGKPYWPTPTGDFYIREILTGYGNPFYGPVSFGTSAHSSVLTDWEGGGGVVGIHGTNTPQILPGRVSHGCVRMKNGPVLRLYRLMQLGTPVAIR